MYACMHGSSGSRYALEREQKPQGKRFTYTVILGWLLWVMA